MIRIFLALVALSYFAFGAWALFYPIEMTSQLGMDVSGRNGSFEIRGIYGGVSLGTAVLCAAGAATASMRRPALWFLVAYMGGYCASRVAAFILDGPPSDYFYSFIAFEAALLLGAVLSLRALPRA
ncbi:MAG: DUF4345 family protein [Pseudomonadota bacterium]